jgi:adenine phosphoribosyltransferase
MTEDQFKSLIREVPDWPEPGVSFKDITPLLADPDALAAAVAAMAEPYVDEGITKVLGIEARGFIFASVIAYSLDAGFVPIRKAGKLPHDIHHQEYDLEYGTDRIEVHSDAVGPGDRILIVDDVLATGGTGRAAIDLVERLGADLCGFTVLAELEFLGGRERLGETDVHTVVHYGPA